ncbi:PIR Superfamily Protein [Plasmodium ovale curtisi]|uniref:PIR Superfamily Protein n=1 Tax=Plasmodium ovale curtisi TaxID=864141 RepID=A0A1A8WSU1_PLAOA|nr:PIR Superfamily Protein [Plasmodium ovale curtisi]
MADGKPHGEIEELSGYTPEDLNSERFYRNRKVQNVNLQKYDRHCNNIYAYKQRNHMIYLCKIVLQYLEQSAQWKEDENQNEYDECILLNYWLYDELYKEFFHEKSYISIAYGNIQTKWANLVNDRRETSYHNKYKPLYDKILKYDDWKKGKELYDYCINYKDIEKMCQFRYEKCGEYCEYVKSKRYLYDHFEKACTTEESYCPHFYDKCKVYNPKTVLKNLKCPDEINTPRATSPRAAFPEAGAMHRSAEQGPRALDGSHGTQSTHESGEIGKKVGHTFLGIAPVLLSATALYRYTPVGAWIRNLGGHNPNSISNMDGGEMEVFLPSTQESGDMIFSDTSNYISYHPI